MSGAIFSGLFWPLPLILLCVVGGVLTNRLMKRRATPNGRVAQGEDAAGRLPVACAWSGLTVMMLAVGTWILYGQLVDAWFRDVEVRPPYHDVGTAHVVQVGLVVLFPLVAIVLTFVWARLFNVRVLPLVVSVLVVAVPAAFLTLAITAFFNECSLGGGWPVRGYC